VGSEQSFEHPHPGSLRQSAAETRYAVTTPMGVHTAAAASASAKAYFCVFACSCDWESARVYVYTAWESARVYVYTCAGVCILLGRTVVHDMGPKMKSLQGGHACQR
jgi:hypothetical protein